MTTAVYDTFFYGTVFKSSAFTYPLVQETDCFQNNAFSKGATFETVLESLHFHQRFQSFHMSCGREAKTHKKECVFVRKRITVVNALAYNW